MTKWIFVLSVILVSVRVLAASEVKRISARSLDVSHVTKLYIAPGMVSVLELPEPILDVKVGKPEGIRVLISQVTPQEITVSLQAIQKHSTNMIVRTQKHVFVLDVIPNLSKHQDYVRVDAGVGRLQNDDQKVIAKEAQVLRSSEIARDEKLLRDLIRRKK